MRITLKQLDALAEHPALNLIGLIGEFAWAFAGGVWLVIGDYSHSSASFAVAIYLRCLRNSDSASSQQPDTP